MAIYTKALEKKAQLYIKKLFDTCKHKNSTHITLLIITHHLVILLFLPIYHEHEHFSKLEHQKDYLFNSLIKALKQILILLAAQGGVRSCQIMKSAFLQSFSAQGSKKCSECYW